jgi:ribulose-phosphate 3-epimerase
LGASVVASLRRITRLPLEIHMMVSAPDLFLEEFVAAGGDSFLVHCEGNNNLHRTVQRIKELRKRAGVVINPATPVSALEDILQDVTQVLIMTVDPGFAHQRFITTTLPKIRRVRRMIDLAKMSCEVEVDGGIDSETAPLAIAAGAEVLVAGTAIFNEGESIAEAMDRLRASVQPQEQERQMRIA